jgi:hypothetical protein
MKTDHLPNHALLQKLYAHILEHPEDNAPRRAYAEALPAGHPRAQLILTQLEIWSLVHARVVREEPHRRLIELRALADRLVAKHAAEWTAPLAALGSKFRFSRGFVETVALSPQDFVQRGQRLLQVAPILSLDVVGTTGFAELCKSPLLERIYSLNLFSQKLGDAGLQLLASSMHARSLRYLDLAFCKLTDAGVMALAASPNLPDLQYVNLASNPCENPTERPGGVDGDHIQDYDFPAFGQQIEQQYGLKRWLHYTPQSASWFPPTPSMFIGKD